MSDQHNMFGAAAARVGTRRPTMLATILLCACGGGEPETVETAEDLYEAHSNNLEAAAEAAPPAAAERLRRAAEIQERRSEALEQKEGQVRVEPVIQDKDGEGAGVAGVDWRLEEQKSADTNERTGGIRAN